jgi:branched-chain amino acid transport system substrate-binding protein
MGNALGVGLPPGLLEGMKGTLPLTELSGDFRRRLLAVNPALVDFNYSAEAYDAVMLLALAAEQVNSTKGVDIASAINSVTQEGEKCRDFVTCKEILDRGGDVDYDGASGTLDFTPAGEPGSGTYGIQTFNELNQIDDSATRYVTVGG